MIKSRVLIALCALATAVPAANAGALEDAVEYRQAAMNVLSWNLSHMAAMVKGEVPFDKAAFAHYAQDLSTAASLRVLDGFPEDSVSDDSDAKDEIWLDWNDFEAKFDKMREASSALSKAADGGDEAVMKAAFKDTGASCKGCHKAYKQ